MNKIIECENIKKVFKQGSETLTILENLNLSINKAEQIAIMGRSGSGKTTLLHLLGGLDNPTEGYIHLLGQNLQNLSGTERAKLRNKSVGFVFQFHHLLPEFTALENVSMPLYISNNLPAKEIKTRAMALLKMVGVEKRASHKSSQLSGGERQRVAIARALIHSPACVLADEPTGNLDEHTAAEILKLILGLNKQIETTFIVVTHDKGIASQMDKIYQLEEGKLHLI